VGPEIVVRQAKSVGWGLVILQLLNGTLETLDDLAMSAIFPGVAVLTLGQRYSRLSRSPRRYQTAPSRRRLGVRFHFLGIGGTAHHGANFRHADIGDPVRDTRDVSWCFLAVHCVVDGWGREIGSRTSARALQGFGFDIYL